MNKQQVITEAQESAASREHDGFKLVQFADGTWDWFPFGHPILWDGRKATDADCPHVENWYWDGAGWRSRIVPTADEEQDGLFLLDGKVYRRAEPEDRDEDCIKLLDGERRETFVIPAPGREPAGGWQGGY